MNCRPCCLSESYRWPQLNSKISSYDRSFLLDRWRRARLIGRVLRYHQLGAHPSQYGSRLERQPDNRGIPALCKDFREQLLPEGYPPAWRFVADKEMSFLPLAQQLRPVIELSLARRHNLPVRRAEVPRRQLWNRRRLRISLRAIPG